MLMEHAEQYARDGGYSAVVLGVRLELPGNLDFYGARGYRVMSQESHPGYATPTFVWMRKDLFPTDSGCISDRASSTW